MLPFQILFRVPPCSHFCSQPNKQPSESLQIAPLVLVLRQVAANKLVVLIDPTQMAPWNKFHKRVKRPNASTPAPPWKWMSPAMMMFKLHSPSTGSVRRRFPATLWLCRWSSPVLSYCQLYYVGDAAGVNGNRESMSNALERRVVKREHKMSVVCKMLWFVSRMNGIHALQASNPR